jgi:hypothetical protein
MKKHIILLIVISGLLGVTSISYYGCRSARVPVTYVTDTLYTNQNGTGELLEITFFRGPEHNHPLMAAWIEDTNGTYIQTLYIAESIAKGIFGHGDKSTGKWLPGPIRRPAALPVWAHSRGVMEEDSLFIPTQATAIPDAYTGPTPPAHFVLLAKADRELPGAFNVLFEINQTWDWNEYWTNNKYPDDEEYKTSCQPALVYKAFVEKTNRKSNIELQLIGHSHYNGSDGEIYSDINTITTAKYITESVSVEIK